MKVVTGLTINDVAVTLRKTIGKLSFYESVKDCEIIYVTLNNAVVAQITLEASQTETSWASVQDIQEI